MNKLKTAVMTDTNSGITVEEGGRDIHVIPMPVIVDSTDYLEGVDITCRELFAAMREGKDIKSSQPSIGPVASMWDKLLEEYDEVVYIPMSSGLSGSYATAAQFAGEYDGKVQVVDNHRISVTLYESVYDALHMAKQGCSAAEIKTRIEKNAYQSSIYISVNSLEYLKKSGRVTAAGAMIASAINLKPVLTIQGEKLDAYAKARGMKQAERKMIEAARVDVTERFAQFPPERIRIGAAGTFEKKEDAKRWEEMLREDFPEHEVYYIPLSCSIACHVGLDAAGMGISVIDR